MDPTKTRAFEATEPASSILRLTSSSEHCTVCCLTVESTSPSKAHKAYGTPSSASRCRNDSISNEPPFGLSTTTPMLTRSRHSQLSHELRCLPFMHADNSGLRPFFTLMRMAVGSTSHFDSVEPEHNRNRRIVELFEHFLGQAFGSFGSI